MTRKKLGHRITETAETKINQTTEHREMSGDERAAAPLKEEQTG